jgi:hypothetical protein
MDVGATTMRAFVRLALVAIFLASPASLRAASPGASQRTADERCSRVLLSPEPAWLSSTVWLPAAEKVLAVDTAHNSLELISPTGQVTALTRPKQELPVLVANTSEGVLLMKFTRNEGPSLLNIGSGLAASGNQAFLRAAQTHLGPVESIYQWVGTDNALLAAGIIQSDASAKGYALGILKLPVAPESSAADLVMRLKRADYYLIGYQYVTAIGSTGYFLRLDGEQASLYKLPPGSSKPILLPHSVPAEFRTLPAIRVKMNGPGDAPAFYRDLERKRFLAGIVGSGADDFLYMLAREPGKTAGQTDWWLYRVDPNRDRVLGRVLLPTKAKHLTMVASPSALLLIERNELEPGGRSQAIPSMVAVPTPLLSRATPEGTAICPDLDR